MKVRVINVGRENWNDEIDLNNKLTYGEIEEEIYKNVRNHLMSSYIDVRIDRSTNKGKIYAGLGCVGEIEIVDG